MGERERELSRGKEEKAHKSDENGKGGRKRKEGNKGNDRKHNMVAISGEQVMQKRYLPIRRKTG